MTERGSRQAIPRSPTCQPLLSGVAIDAAALAPGRLGLAPLFSFADGHQCEILLLGVDGDDDIVYRYRTRAFASGLRGPEIRAQYLRRDRESAGRNRQPAER